MYNGTSKVSDCLSFIKRNLVLDCSSCLTARHATLQHLYVYWLIIYAKRKEEVSASKFNVNMRAQFGLNFFLTQLLPEDVI